MLNTESLPDNVRASLRRHVAAALDDPTLYNHGILYNVTLDAHVIPLVTADCPPVQRPLVAPLLSAPRSSDAWRTEHATDRAYLAGLPRGEWLIRFDGTYYRPLMSAGNGELTGHSDTCEEMPTWQHVYERMMGYEIYLMRKEIEAERARAADLAALPAFSVGQIIKDVKINWVTFSKAEVVDVAPPNAEPGRVALRLTKRGTGKRWGATVRAAWLASQVLALPA